MRLVKLITDRHRKVEFVQNQSVMVYGVRLIPSCRWIVGSVENFMLLLSHFVSFCVVFYPFYSKTVFKIYTLYFKKFTGSPSGASRVRAVIFSCVFGHVYYDL